MPCSNLLRLVTAIGVALLAPSVATWAQSVSADQSVKPAEVVVQSCWDPGLSRNIGIAEPGCDAPMAKAMRPANPQRNEEAPGSHQAPPQPGAD